MDRPFDRPCDSHLDELELLIPEDDAIETSDPKPEIGPAVAALTAALFLLACAFAAFSGWMHSTDDRYAYFGILGAVASLLAAGIGICLAGSGARRNFSCRFLSVCALSLASVYGGLLFLASR